MRKTSHDGGDSTSITSGIENEIKKTGAIIKTKRTSLKRKVQNFSLESDDAVIEPLLQKDKEKADTTKQGAKFNLMSKPKTEITSERETDKDKLISDDKLQKAVLSKASDISDRVLPTSNLKENSTSKSSVSAPLHNHMNTNVFSNHDGLKTFVAPKSQILVEIDGSKHVGYNPSPLIFTTAKIHTDNKTKHMEPVQMTPVPILSTIEVSVNKTGIYTGETSDHITTNISAVYIPQSNNNITEQDPKVPLKTINNTTNPQNKVADTKNQILTGKGDVKSNTFDKSSLPSSSNKETKLTQPNFSPSNAKDSTDNEYINKENKIEKKEHPNKTLTSQSSFLHCNPSTLEKSETKFPQDSKSGPTSVATTKGTNNSIKESGLFNQTVTTKQDKLDARLYPENKFVLNKTVKPESGDASKSSDKVNNFDKTSKEKNIEPTSFSNRELQRQNVVLDKDDPLSKLKPNIVSPTLSKNPKGFDKSAECQKSSTGEINTFSNEPKLPKSSANSFSINSVTSVSTNISTTDNNTNASITPAAALNKKSNPVTSPVAVNQIACTVVNFAVTNNSSAAITTSVSANKSSFPTTSSAHKTFDPITATSNVKNMSADGIKTSAPITTAAAMKNKNKFAPLTTTAAVNTTAAGNKRSTSSFTAGNKITSPSSTTTSDSKISAPTTITAAEKKKSSLPTGAAASNKISSPLTTTATSTTGNETFTQLTTTTTGNKISSPSTSTTTSANKVSCPSTTFTAGSKISSPSTTTTAGNKMSVSSTTGNKITNPITTTGTANKTSGPVITTAATKLTSGCTTTTTGVNKTSTSNSNSLGKPIINLSSTSSTISNTPVTKPTIVTTSSALNPLYTEKKSSNESGFGNLKSGAVKETSTTKSQAISTINQKPATTKPSKLTTVTTPITTSQQTTVIKSPTVTTVSKQKSGSTKTISQPTVKKSTEMTPKSSTSNEKPFNPTVKSNSTSLSSTTSGTSNVTSAAPVASSGSASSVPSSKSADATKQSDSKVISNGSKSFKA